MSESAELQRGHHVEWWVCGDYIDAQFGCYEPPGADCRLLCPEGCESWDAADHEHPLAPAPECNALTFFNNGDEPTDYYSGPNHLIENGPIEIEFDGEHYVWSYAKQEAEGA